MRFICNKFWYEGVQKCDNNVQIECQKSHYIMYGSMQRENRRSWSSSSLRKTVSSIILVESRSTNSWTIPSFFKKKKWCNDKKILTAMSETVSTLEDSSNLEPAGFSPHCFSFSLSHPHCSPVAPGCIEPLGTRITRVLRRRTKRETI